jgi:hypothetical protein
MQKSIAYASSSDQDIMLINPTRLYHSREMLALCPELGKRRGKRDEN